MKLDRIADLSFPIQGTLKACTERTFCSPAHAAALTNLTNGPNPVLIIDDIGFSRPVAQRFLDPNIALTFSLLLRLPPTSQPKPVLTHQIILHI